MKYEELEAGLRREKRRREAGKAKKRRRILLIGALALLTAGVLWAFIAGPLRPAAGRRPNGPLPAYSPETLPGETARLQLIDVGQGLALLAESRGEAVLIDGGGGRASEKTVAVLKQRGITRLKLLAVTHYDEDHMGGAVGALAAIGAETVLGPDYTKDSRTFRSLIRHIREAGLTLIHPAPGSEYRVGTLTVTVLGPLSAEPHPVENDNSLVLRLTDGKNSLLLTGDAEEAAEAELVGRWGRALGSDIYVAGHHGSRTSSAGSLLAAVRPRHALISCGAGNEYGHPHTVVLERLTKAGADIRRTDTQGDIRLIFTEDGIVWEKPPAAD